MGSKAKYRIRNWSHYNKSLVQRGSITLWFSEESLEAWNAAKDLLAQGRPKFYSDAAILACLMLRSVFHLTLRALVGFLFSLISLLQLAIPIPSYTQICRRAKSIGITINRVSKKKPTDIVFDSSRLKVYGEGESAPQAH